MLSKEKDSKTKKKEGAFANVLAGEVQ